MKYTLCILLFLVFGCSVNYEPYADTKNDNNWVVASREVDKIAKVVQEKVGIVDGRYYLFSMPRKESWTTRGLVYDSQTGKVENWEYLEGVNFMGKGNYDINKFKIWAN